jgi:hypothetical protein
MRYFHLKIAHAIVSILNLQILALDELTRLRRQVVSVECGVKSPHGCVFAALALADDRGIVAPGDGGLQVHPAAVQSPRYAAAALRFTAETANLALKLNGKLRSLVGELSEKQLQVTALDAFGCLAEALLTVSAAFNEIVQDRNCLVV